MTRKKIEKGSVRCPECKVWSNRTVVKLHGFNVRAWECPKCKEEILDPIDVDRTILLKQMQQSPPIIKIGGMREGSYIRFPKEYAPLAPKGMQAKITPKDEDEFIVKILE